MKLNRLLVCVCVCGGAGGGARVSDHAVGGDNERKHYAKEEDHFLPDNKIKQISLQISQGRVTEKEEL